MVTRRTKLLLLLGGLVLVGQGCISVQFGAKTKPDGGIWKTSDRGETWVQKSAVPTVAPAARSIVNVNVNGIVQDPQDPQALYLSTNENGLIYSYDGGESWTQASKLAAGRINAVSIDPRNKCVIFVAQANRILKSVDCSRTFGVSYFDARNTIALTTVFASTKKANEVFAGTSAGDLLKSNDGGTTWTTIKIFPSQIVRVVLDPFSNANLYVATKGSGVWKSTDEGKTWGQLTAGLAQFGGSNEVSHFVADETATDSFFMVSRYGILHTPNGGGSWEAVDLLTPPGSTLIYSFALNQKNPREMYYGTATTFYKTADGGEHWATKRLPTTRAATALLLDISNPSVLYLGGTQLKK